MTDATADLANARGAAIEAARQGDAHPFVNGKTVAGEGPAHERASPATGQLAVRVFDAAPDLVDSAVASARAAFEKGLWSGLSPSKRVQILHDFADRIEADAIGIGALDCIDMGKPISNAVGDAIEAAGMIRSAAESSLRLEGQLFSSSSDLLAFGRDEPVGVVAAITPWNYPMQNFAGKVGPALAAGNSVLVKPSEIASRSAIRTVRHALDAGVPAEVLHVLTGRGQTIGAALASHMDVDLMSFTGSTGAGGAIMQAAGASNLKRLLLECGGKSPQILFADVRDLEAVIGELADDAFANSGQLCVAKTRLLVERSIHDEVLAALTGLLPHYCFGDPLLAETAYGPLATDRQTALVEQEVELAVRDGATAHMVDGHGLKGAVLLSGAGPRHGAFAKELFAPVLTITPFATEDEAIALANDSIYGLAASVWTSSLARAHRMSRRLRVGSVDVHTGPRAGLDLSVPMASAEPLKQSGFGAEGGMAGVRSYTIRKLVGFSA